MAGTVVTISPRESLARVERLVRARLARDGAVTLAAKSGDARQLRQLGRLRGQLAADPGLSVSGGVGEADGVAYLSVTPAGQRSTGWWGSPKTG